METRKPWSFCETPQEKCTINYCDDNGCQNRKRHYVSGVKCLTFDKEAQENLPQHIKDKMKADKERVQQSKNV